MDPNIHEEKENIFFFTKPVNPQPLIKFPCIQLLPSTATANAPQKKAKAKPKAQKTATTNVRAGDWVCLVCNNLNFSFRNECNRCQTQTKKQNFIQGLILMSDTPKSEQSPVKRPPLKDVTNQVPPQHTFNHPEMMLSKAKSTPHVEVVTVKEQPKEKESNKLRAAEPQKSCEVPLPANRGFENMLLVTPPKAKVSRGSIVFKEYFDSNQKVFPAYKSPQQLPSISPMLRRIANEDSDIRKDLEHFFKLGSPNFGDNVSSQFTPQQQRQQPMRPVSHVEEVPVYLKHKGPVNVHELCSTDASPEVSRTDSCYSGIEASDSPKRRSPVNLYYGNIESYQQRLAKERHESKMDWNCPKCGIRNSGVRQGCNRCSLIR